MTKFFFFFIFSFFSFFFTFPFSPFPLFPPSLPSSPPSPMPLTIQEETLYTANNTPRNVRAIVEANEHHFPQFLERERNSPTQHFSNRWNYPLPQPNTFPGDLFTQYIGRITNPPANGFFFSEEGLAARIASFLFAELIENLPFSPFNSNFYIKIFFVGDLLKSVDGGGRWTISIPQFQNGLTPISFFSSPQALDQVGVSLQNFQANFITVLSELLLELTGQRAVTFSEQGIAGGYTTNQFVEWIRIVLIAAPPVPTGGSLLRINTTGSLITDIPVACNIKKGEARNLKYFICADESTLLAAHPVESENNTCVFFPSSFNRYLKEKSLKQVKLPFFLMNQKKDFLGKFYPEELPNAAEWVANLNDPLILSQLVEFFGVHLSIFIAYNYKLNSTSARENFLCDVFYDSRQDPVLRSLVPANKYFSFIIAQPQGKDNPYHAYPILNDEGSIYYNFKKFCDRCQTVFLNPPLAAKPHFCTGKKVTYVANKLDGKNVIFATAPFTNSSDHREKVERDDGSFFSPQLNSLNSIPSYKKNPFKGCKYTPDKRLLFYDLETLFRHSNANQGEVYAVGAFSEWDKNYRDFFGRESMVQFLDFLLGLPFGVKLIAYNGAKFDSLFLVRNILKKRGSQFNVSNFLVNNGELLQCKITNAQNPEIVHEIWDLYKFTLTSLGKACKSAGCQFQKSFFPHDLIKDWPDLDYIGPIPHASFYPPQDRGEVEKMREEKPDYVFNLREECLKYLELDVLSMRSLFKRQEDSFHEILINLGEEDFHFTKFFSISQLGNEVCNHFLRSKGITIYPPKDADSFDLFKSGYKGGRVDYFVKDFKSDHFDDLMATPEEERGPEHYEREEKFYRYPDITSLYPSVMLFFPYPFGLAFWVQEYYLQKLEKMFSDCEYDSLTKRRLTESRALSDFLFYWEKHLLFNPAEPNQEERFFFPEESAKLPWQERLTCSYWELDFEPPRDSSFPYHLYKTKSGKLQSDNFPNRGWYYSPDVYCMIKAGYKITKVRHVIGWLGFGHIYAPAIKALRTIKDEGEKQGDQTKRSQGKTMLNSLYGKQGQNPSEETLEIHHDSHSFFKFMATHVLTDSQWINYEDSADGDFFTINQGKTRKEFMGPFKPVFQAAFVTAYSRLFNWVHYITPMMRKCPEIPMGYHDTDSFITSNEAYEAIPRELVEDESRKGQFGLIKDDLGKGIPEYVSMKTDKPPKIIRLLVGAKKLYFMVYILPNGKVGMNFASKGIAKDDPSINMKTFTDLIQNPGKPGQEFKRDFSLSKVFFSSKSLKREAELFNQDLKRKRLKIMEEGGNDLETADRLNELPQDLDVEEFDDEEDIVFTISKKEELTRRLNMKPVTHRFFDVETNKVLPWGHLDITPEMIKSFKESHGTDYTFEMEKRFTYKPLKEVCLNPNTVQALMAKNFHEFDISSSNAGEEELPVAEQIGFDKNEEWE